MSPGGAAIVSFKGMVDGVPLPPFFAGRSFKLIFIKTANDLAL
jgi:hypothetical protein